MRKKTILKTISFLSLLLFLLIVVGCNKQDVEANSIQYSDEYSNRYDLSLSSLTPSPDLLQQNKGCFSGDNFSLDKVNGVVRGKDKITKNTYIPSLDIQSTGVLWVDGAILNCGAISLQSFGKIILTNGAQVRVSSIVTFKKSKLVIYDDFKENEQLQLSRNSLRTDLGKSILSIRGSWHDIGIVANFFNCSEDNGVLSRHKLNWSKSEGCFSGDNFHLDKINSVVRGKTKIAGNTYIPSLDIQSTGVLWVDRAILNCGTLSLQSFSKIILTNGAQIRASSIVTHKNSKIAVYDHFKEDEILEHSRNSFKNQLRQKYSVYKRILA